jgi:hypothetical protein
MAIREGGGFWAITSGDPGDQKIWRVKRNGELFFVADLAAFEVANNPHPATTESNPFDVAELGNGKALVADAAGNTLLKVQADGTSIKVVAVFPDELVPTSNAKKLVGCPNPPVPEDAEICGLPDMIPTEAVPTSVAVGPDGSFYVGELKGFPFPLGESRIWKIDRDARDVQCGESPKCKVVFDGFTSIIDLAFGPDGKLYVAQIEDASVFALETGEGANAIGGSVHACNLKKKSCEEVRPALPMLTSIAFRCFGQGGQGAPEDVQRGSTLHSKPAEGCSGICDNMTFHQKKNSKDCANFKTDEHCWDISAHNKHPQCPPVRNFILWASIFALVPGQTDVIPVALLPLD